VAGEHQEHARCQQLVLTQDGAVLLGADKSTEQVFRWARTALGDEPREVRHELALAAVRLSQTVERSARQEQRHASRDVVRPALEHLAVRRWQAQQVRDDQRRQWVGEVLHQV